MLLRRVLFVFLFLLFAGSSLAVGQTLPLDQRPEWVSRDGIVMAGSWEPLLFRVRRDGGSGYTPTPEQRAAYEREQSPEMIERLKALGVNFVMMHCYKGGGLELERESMADAVRFSKLCHDAGLRVGVYNYSGAFMWDTFFKEVPAAKDWILLNEGGKPIIYGGAAYRYYWNRNHPDAVRFYKDTIKFAIEEVGTDLIHFDNYHYGPGYDANSIERFRRYLREEFTPEQLKSMNAENPDIVQPPKSGGADDLLRRVWLDFFCRSLADSYSEMGRYARTLRKDILVECNPQGPREWIHPPIDHGNLLRGGEAFWDEGARSGFQNGKLQTSIRTYKVARSMDNIAFRYVLTPLEMAESMAFNLDCLGCIYWFEYGEISNYPGEKNPVEPKTVPFVRFFHQRRDLLRDAEVVADVAVMRSFPSQVFAPKECRELTNKFEQTLIENRACFQIIYDHQLGDLKRYKALVLAGCAAMSDEHIEQIKSYVAGGGRLCVIGPLATHDEWMLPRDKPPLEDIPNDRVFRFAPKRNPLSAVRRTCDDRLLLDVSAPLGLCAELTEQNGRRLVHLVNYRPDGPVEKIKVDLQLPPGSRAASVALAGPGHEQDLELPFEQKQDAVEFTVPSVDIYEIAVVKFEPPSAKAEEPAGLKDLLSRPILKEKQTMEEVQRYCESRVPPPPRFDSVDQWQAEAERLRASVLEKIVFRGEAAKWRDAPTKVEWLETIPGGPGYHIKKLRYEALPGLWIPALLYEPEKLSGKAPAILNFNGHCPEGKQYLPKQMRCINQAKRGMLALNVEWLGMGQLHTDNFLHYRMNQLDLCGTSGLATYYLCAKRGLDVLLSLENADPERVAVTGLSGGGWQTIFFSSLDTRVKLAVPVAGYSGFNTRARHTNDLGDSEQTPSDLATVLDYTHLTAMMAPRPTLLIYNSKDDCCFQSGYALPPLLDVALPAFRLFGKENSLRWHVNDEPGTHNYEQDNREASYRMFRDFFYAGSGDFEVAEIPCKDELKSKEDLFVELPAKNEDFNSLALKLAENLPRQGGLPTKEKDLDQWRQAGRKRLREIVHMPDFQVQAEKADADRKSQTIATFWKLKMDDTWTVPATELCREQPKKTAILIADSGREQASGEAARLLDSGYRVIAFDPFYFGESKIAELPHLFALLIACVGGRPLGEQAGQIAAVARWVQAEHPGEPITLVAIGPRLSTAALIAAALEPKAVGQVELHGAMKSLKEIISRSVSVENSPELFCFGLLESFDVKQIAALVAPRQVSFLPLGK